MPVAAVGDYLKRGRSMSNGNPWKTVYLALKENGMEATLWLSQTTTAEDGESSIAVVTSS